MEEVRTRANKHLAGLSKIKLTCSVEERQSARGNRDHELKAWVAW